MPSSIAHGLAAAAVGAVCYPGQRSRFYAVAAAGAVLLDLDAIGRPFALGDAMWLGGHRALTHSLPFAAMLGAAAVAIACRGSSWHNRRIGAWAFFAIAFALHGALDALTKYGEGVMFFAPFSVARFKAPWQPFNAFVTEVIVVWLPALVILWYRRRSRLVGLSSPAA